MPKITLLNIDSTYRSMYPKHIYKSNNKVLPNNPLYFTLNSNIIKINYPLHNLLQGDNIIIQNVSGIYKILSNPIYLINNFKYAMIYFENNLININYTQFTKDLYINIEIYGNQTENNLIKNIPFNYLLGIKKVLIANDIAESTLNLLTNISTELFNSFNINLLNQHCLFFELPNIFVSDSDYNINQIFKISYLHINGIKLGNINANYPINNFNYQNSYTINKINNENEFEILLNYYSFNTSNEGGDKIQIFKIINSILGYPYVDNYTIFLKKSFNNITNIELVSSEFPYIDILIKENINDKLYWKNIEDGDYIYKVIIPSGFYNATNLIDKLNSSINKVERINSNIIKKYNNFDITLDISSHIISFKPYNLTKLPNSLSIKLITIDNDNYYVLNISHPNNIVDINDTIIISQSTNITLKDIVNINQILSIDASYINKTHTVYNKNLENQTYDIILGKKSQIKITIANTESSGGEDILIKSKTQVSFYFNKNDTFGDILGFKNVGDDYSITEFNSIITNQDNYIYSNNLDSVGNIIQYNNGFINLDGKYNYILMYINDIEYIYTNNNNIQPAFAKILLSGNPGDVLFNTFVQYPNNIYSKNFPISCLSYIDIKFLYPDGSRVNFRNINHSFTLKITEEI